MSKFKLEFVSYDATPLSWCIGTLVLKVNGRKVVFSSCPTDYPRFWRSGGHIDSVDGTCLTGPWEVMEWYLPKRWRRHAQEFCDVMNDNVRQGCCGGCL